MLYNMSYPHDQPGAPAGQPPVKPAVASATRPRPRCSQPMPFDPEELSQKLNKVLSDQKLHAERRRRAKAEAAAATGNGAFPTAAAAHPQLHASLARECFEQGSFQPGTHRPSVAARPRTEPSANRKPTSTTPKETRPKSKISEDDRQSSKSADKERKGSGEKHHHHYIPQFAASQFARTTTADGGIASTSKGLVHKLSRTALRIAQAHREKHQQERNNFYSDRNPELGGDSKQALDRANRERNHHRHTIEGAPAGGRAAGADHRTTRRSSTGDLLTTWDSGTSSPDQHGNETPDVPDRDPDQHRVDWTQSDEAPQHQHQHQQQKSKPSLRKADSIWALKNRLGAFTKHRQEEQQQPSRDGSPPSDTSLRSPKSGFFSRFKVTH